MEPFVVDLRHYEREREAARRGDAGALAALAAYDRVNALACILSAGRGWLGASFSCCELLTTLYFGLDERRIVLSKGHAAAMQYACLYGLGRIARPLLLSYKNGPGALQAHTDRGTPGILLDTGSLGQALSKTIGLAWHHPEARHAVVLGDGELQEGQVFEALQTLAHRRLCQVTPIFDLNGFQTERPISQVKRIADLRQVIEGLGLRAVELDGHDPAAIASAWRAAAAAPTALLAHTIKAGGSSFLVPDGERQPWHSRVPDAQLALAIVTEQLERAGRSAVLADFAAHRVQTEPPKPRKVQATAMRAAAVPAAAEPARPAAGPTAAAPGPAAPARPAVSTASAAAPPATSAGPAVSTTGAAGPAAPVARSTRDGFADRLVRLVRERPDVVVLSADLAHACGLDPLDGHPRLLEMGISEQDMVSCAGGLALDGRLPVVATYAAFLRRAYEQMLVNAGDGTKLVYAANYAGLCYFTDGKTHQSLNDVVTALSIPDLVVADPATAAEAAQLLDWAAGPQPAAVYLRLRRTPIALELPGELPPVGAPRLVGAGPRCFVTSGTVATRLALDCLADPTFSGWSLIVQGVLRGPIDKDRLARRLRGVERIVTIEDNLSPGPLAALLRRLTAEFGIHPRIDSRAVNARSASFRTLGACLQHFGFTVEAIRDLVGE